MKQSELTGKTQMIKSEDLETGLITVVCSNDIINTNVHFFNRKLYQKSEDGHWVDVTDAVAEAILASITRKCSQ